MAGTFLLDWLRVADYQGLDACVWRYAFAAPTGNYPNPGAQLIYGLTLILIGTQYAMVYFDGGDVADQMPAVLPCWLLTDIALPSPCDCPDDYFLGHLGQGFTGGSTEDPDYWSGEFGEGGFGPAGCYNLFPNCIAMRLGDDDLPTHAVYLTKIPVT